MPNESRGAISGEMNIANGATTTTEAVNVQHFALGSVTLPSSFVGTRLSVKHSLFRHGTYTDVYVKDAAGTSTERLYVSVSGRGGDTVVLPAELAGLAWIKFVFLNDSEVEQTQTSAIELEYLIKA